MPDLRLYISHKSALHFWRTNPPSYVLEGEDRDIRVLRNCPKTHEDVLSFHLSEAEFGPKPIDVLVPKGGPRPSPILRHHIQNKPLPHHSLIPLRDGIHLVSPALCFVQLCNEVPFPKALELGMELCGTYAKRPDDIADKASRNYPLTSAYSLRRKTSAWKGLHGIESARMAATYLVDNSASPMESKLYLLLCLPQKHGGYNIPKPEMNTRIDIPMEAQLILRQHYVKPDLLWRAKKLIVEYDGGYHNDPQQTLKDEKRRVILESIGYTVVVVKKQQIYDPIAFSSVATMIAKRCGKRIRPLTLKQQFARESLRALLLG